jgi:hypothetical protein
MSPRVPPSILESLVLSEAAAGLVGREWELTMSDVLTNSMGERRVCETCVREIDEGTGSQHLGWWHVGTISRATPDEVARYLARRGR